MSLPSCNPLHSWVCPGDKEAVGVPAEPVLAGGSWWELIALRLGCPGTAEAHEEDKSPFSFVQEEG